MELTNGGADPVTIAQVQVDDAYWEFDIQPDATIPRLGRATISIPYPWVQDEAHFVKLLTSMTTSAQFARIQAALAPVLAA